MRKMFITAAIGSITALTAFPALAVYPSYFHQSGPPPSTRNINNSSSSMSTNSFSSSSDDAAVRSGRWQWIEDEPTLLEPNKTGHWMWVNGAMSSSSSSVTPNLPNTGDGDVDEDSDDDDSSSSSSSSSVSSRFTNDNLSDADACVLSAMQDRETAMMDALDAYQTSISGALRIRSEALDQAWMNDDRVSRLQDMNAAWRSFQTAWKNASATLRRERNDLWQDYISARKACHPSTIDNENSWMRIDQSF